MFAINDTDQRVCAAKVLRSLQLNNQTHSPGKQCRLMSINELKTSNRQNQLDSSYSVKPLWKEKTTFVSCRLNLLHNYSCDWLWWMSVDRREVFLNELRFLNPTELAVWKVNRIFIKTVFCCAYAFHIAWFFVAFGLLRWTRTTSFALVAFVLNIIPQRLQPITSLIPWAVTRNLESTDWRQNRKWSKHLLLLPSHCLTVASILQALHSTCKKSAKR